MNKIHEFIFLISVMFLHVSGFLQLSPIFSGDNIILFLGLLVGFTNKRLRAVELSSASKTAFYFGALNIMLIPLFIQLKNLLFIGTPTVVGYEETTKDYFDALPFLRMIIRLTLVFYFLKYLNIDKKHFIRGMNALYFFAVVITLSMLFESIFSKLGFVVTKIGEEGSLNDSERYSGITGLMVNSTGAMLGIMFGVLLIMFKHKFFTLKKTIIFGAFILIGTLMTGSRTALVIISVMYFMYFISELKTIKLSIILLNILVFLILLFVFVNYSDTTLSRFQANKDVGYGGLGLRISYWEIFINDIIENPNYLWIGNLDWPDYKRSPHNFFIYLIFSSGVLISFYFFTLLKNLIVEINNSHRLNLTWGINPYYIIIPQLLFWGTSLEPFTWFGLIFLMSSGIYFKPNGEILSTYTVKSFFRKNIT